MTFIRNDPSMPHATPHHGAVQAGASSATSRGSAVTDEAAKLERAAKDFEAVFLRQMLSALEKTTKVGDHGPNVAGQQTYGSMIVEAVADAVAAAGGLGLSAVLTKNLAGKLATPVAGPPETAKNGPIATSGAAASKSMEFVALRGGSDFEKNSPQGFPSHAVPRTEIRATASSTMGQQADRRIR